MRFISYKQRLEIREAYRKNLSMFNGRYPASPYDFGIDWFSKYRQSPIERNVFAVIRFLGLPLYPEFPVGKYFVDFGDPYSRIAIEVDSKQWHQDEDKDIKKDKDLRKMGWRVYRFPSRITYKVQDDFYDADGYMPEDAWKEYLEDTSEGRLRVIYDGIDRFRGHWEVKKIK